MKLVATIVMASLFALLAAAPGVAQSASERVTAGDAFAQSEPRRARTRLRVRPVYPYRRYHSLYPVPYDIEYPGPNAKRECVDALRHRASSERHRDRAAHALPVGAGLSSVVAGLFASKLPQMPLRLFVLEPAETTRRFGR